MNALARGLTRWVARAALSRPDAALVASSGGAPRMVDGRTLDPRFQFLEARARMRPIPALLTPAIARAQTRELVRLFGGRMEPGVRAQPLTLHLEGRSLPARAYRPEDQDLARPAMAYFHFGGGVVGDLDTCHAFCSILAKAMRAPVLSVEYRLAPEHPFPAGLEDARDAYLWLLDHADQFAAPKGIASIGGDSMGGNFAAVVAQEAKRAGFPAPAFQLLIYPATDMTAEAGSMLSFGDAFPLTRDTMSWFMSHYLPAGADRRDVRLSPALAPDLSGLAPALVYTAGFDPLADQGAAYAQALRAAGVPVTFRCFDSLAHGFTAFTGAIPAADAACRAMAQEAARAASA